MRTLPILLSLGLPAAALAEVPPPRCLIVHECDGTVCAPVGNGDTYAFEPVPGGLRMTNINYTEQTMTLETIPGEGTQSWVGRSPRTQGAVLVSMAEDGRVALTVHNRTDPGIVYSLILDCAVQTSAGATK